MKFNPSHIVIDADIARAVGFSEHPVSSTSRALLEALMASKDIGIAFNRTLLDEWKKHQSTFARTWLSSMIAKRRFHLIKTVPGVAEGVVQSAPITDVQKKIAAKDAHLIDIALASGKFIASNDKTARAVFCLVSGNTPLFHGIIWAVPIDCSTTLLSLLEERGFIPADWHICSPLIPVASAQLLPG
jgi:hypothetical protein